MPRVDPKDWDAVRILIGDIQALESRAHRLKMIETAHSLNAAKNKAGWEFEGQISDQLDKHGAGRIRRRS